MITNSANSSKTVTMHHLSSDEQLTILKVENNSTGSADNNSTHQEGKNLPAAVAEDTEEGSGDVEVVGGGRSGGRGRGGNGIR